MTDLNPTVYGTVSGLEAGGDLLVKLDNGEHGISAAEETVEASGTQRKYPARLIGRRMGFIANGRRGDGRISLSIRQFEEAEYRRICDDFRSGKRNVYDARLISTTPDGKLAFYRLAQGVNGALHVSQFSLCRLYSFSDIQLPRKMTVAVINVDAKGWLSLSAKPAFGDFEYSVNRLALSEGAEAEGVVTNILPDGAVSVMLAPNLSVLTDQSVRVAVGERVRLRCRRIDRELHRVKAVILAKLGTNTKAFHYETWTRPANELGDWVDAVEFDRRIRPVRMNRDQQDASTVRQTSVDFRIATTRSPFSTFRNERIVRDPQRPGRVQDIRFETRMGYLNDRHMQVACALEELRYSSAWQIRRYLYLTRGVAMAERELKSIIDRLIKHNIAAVLRFQSTEGNLLTRVLYPSANWQDYCGKPLRCAETSDAAQMDASAVKSVLAANQLLIGLMRTGGETEAIDTYPLLESDGNRLRPRHMIRQGGITRYLEAARIGGEEEALNRLLAYDRLLGPESGAEVVLVLEESRYIAPMQARIDALDLRTVVRLTDDLSCLGTADET